jgi:hypothetical protein
MAARIIPQKALDVERFLVAKEQSKRAESEMLTALGFMVVLF